MFAKSEVKDWRHIEILDKHVDRIFVAEICELTELSKESCVLPDAEKSSSIAGDRESAVPSESDMRIHVYKLSNERPEEFGGSLSGCGLACINRYHHGGTSY
jgi:hypothetical protein